MKKILLMILFSLFVISFVSAEGTSSGSGGGGGEGAKIYHIDDTFKVGWTDGTDNYEAEYKVWKIEETADGNRTTLLLMPTGIIGISNKKEGDSYLLGYGAKINFKQIYVSGDDFHMFLLHYLLLLFLEAVAVLVVQILQPPLLVEGVVEEVHQHLLLEVLVVEEEHVKNIIFAKMVLKFNTASGLKKKHPKPVEKLVRAMVVLGVQFQLCVHVKKTLIHYAQKNMSLQ